MKKSGRRIAFQLEDTLDAVDGLFDLFDSLSGLLQRVFDAVGDFLGFVERAVNLVQGAVGLGE